VCPVMVLVFVRRITDALLFALHRSLEKAAQKIISRNHVPTTQLVHPVMVSVFVLRKANALLIVPVQILDKSAEIEIYRSVSRATCAKLRVVQASVWKLTSASLEFSRGGLYILFWLSPRAASSLHLRTKYFPGSPDKEEV